MAGEEMYRSIIPVIIYKLRPWGKEVLVLLARVCSWVPLGNSETICRGFSGI